VPGGECKIAMAEFSRCRLPDRHNLIVLVTAACGGLKFGVRSCIPLAPLDRRETTKDSSCRLQFSAFCAVNLAIERNLRGWLGWRKILPGRHCCPASSSRKTARLRILFDSVFLVLFLSLYLGFATPLGDGTPSALSRMGVSTSWTAAITQ